MKHVLLKFVEVLALSVVATVALSGLWFFSPTIWLVSGRTAVGALVPWLSFEQGPPIYCVNGGPATECGFLLVVHQDWAGFLTNVTLFAAIGFAVLLWRNWQAFTKKQQALQLIDAKPENTP